MKPTSKKDYYIVKCETINESSEVKFFLNGHRTQVLWRFICSHKDILKSYDFLNEQLENLHPKYRSLPIISFEEWQNLPDEPNDVYSNSEFNSERFETKCGHVYTEDKKLIGYKLIKKDYLDAVNCICKRESRENKNFLLYNKIYVNSDYYSKIKDAEILHWFEPVYKDESIKLKSGKVLTASEIEEVKEILKNK